MSKMVPYHEPSIIFAKEMTRDLKTPLEKYLKITNYITRTIRYDYVRAVTIPKKNGIPDVKRTWETKTGICLDTAALTTGMLRAVGINARMCFGRADKQNHAWVEADILGKKYRYDHDGKAKVYKVERTF